MAAPQDHFASFLRERLRALEGGALPSAAELARRFNEMNRWEQPISAETMRRWLHGLALPELSRFASLCAMLRCDPKELLSRLTSPDVANNGAALTGEAAARSTTGSSLEHDRAALLAAIERMDADRIRALRLFVLDTKND